MANLTKAERAAQEADAVETERIAVIERRLQNVFGEPSVPIRFKELGKFARWFNSGLRPDTIYRAKQMGWTGVTPDQIVDLSQIGTYTLSPEGYVARGERAQEVLMWMPEREFHKIQLAKTKKNLELARDGSKQGQEMLNAAAKKYGGNFAEQMSRHVRTVGGVTDTVERIERTGEALE